MPSCMYRRNLFILQSHLFFPNHLVPSCQGARQLATLWGRTHSPPAFSKSCLYSVLGAADMLESQRNATCQLGKPEFFSRATPGWKPFEGTLYNAIPMLPRLQSEWLFPARPNSYAPTTPSSEWTVNLPYRITPSSFSSQARCHTSAGTGTQ